MSKRNWITLIVLGLLFTGYVYNWYVNRPPQPTVNCYVDEYGSIRNPCFDSNGNVIQGT